MSQTIPAFVQYQEPMFPLRGLWNNAPPEGNYFVNCTLAWSTLSAPAVQFSLAGNSPVSISQIVALYVDNSRCGSDIDFLFPDSGFVLSVPAHTSGLFPVLTNALMFYAISTPPASGVTVFQILNSLPPPIMIDPSVLQNNVSETGIPLAQPDTYIPLVQPPTGGMLTGFSITWGGSTDNLPTANLDLVDGTGKIVWAGTINNSPGELSTSGLNVPFSGGLRFGILGSDYSTGEIFINLYYTTP